MSQVAFVSLLFMDRQVFPPCSVRLGRCQSAHNKIGCPGTWKRFLKLQWLGRQLTDKGNERGVGILTVSYRFQGMMEADRGSCIVIVADETLE